LHPILTSIGPLVAPTGTVTVRLVPVDAVMVAGTPLNETVFEKGVLKLVPVMLTDVPIGPPAGVNEVMVGAGMNPMRL
jgi:hypothetical protein